nr:hypothetical protein [Tanacetum cinerariifolium]
MTDLNSEKYSEMAQTESNLYITSNDINIELNKEFLEELQMNKYHRWIDEDVINHIAMVLKMIDSIYIPGVDSHQLQMKIFPLSLAYEAKQWWINEGEGKITIWEELVENFFYVINHIAMVLKMIDSIYIPGVDSHQLQMKIFPLSLAYEAKQWWINEGEGKITIWEELVEKFFCKIYPESYDGEEEMLDAGDNWGIDPLEFISRINSLFDIHMKMDGRAKKVLLHAWMNGS